MFTYISYAKKYNAKLPIQKWLCVILSYKKADHRMMVKLTHVIQNKLYYNGYKEFWLNHGKGVLFQVIFFEVARAVE